MITREDRERMEAQLLDPRAARSADSAGRQRPEEEDPIRTVFQRDRDRILHSDAFRRLSHKTQVFIAPDNDHYRTRLTHTLEVAQISRTIARALGLNEDLTEAIALGHDLGHTPFGHVGEVALNQALFRYHGLASDSEPLFSHNLQSLRVIDHIEGGGKGLNLTAEVRDGIVHHTGGEKARTLEGRIVAIADRIAYVNHDIDDALRAGLMTEDQIPDHAVALLGTTRSDRIDTMVTDMIQESQRQGDIVMTQPIWDIMMELRAFLNTEVYRRADVREQGRVHEVMDSLFEYYIQHPDRLPELYLQETGGDEEQAVVDCIASMTDRYALAIYQSLFTESMLP